MKKFLATLLIAFISCSAVEDISLSGLYKKRAPAPLNETIKYLKEERIYEQLQRATVNVGKAFAVNLCSKYVSQDLCHKVVLNLE